MKNLKDINYRLVLKRLKVAFFSIKLITAIWKLLNMVFNYYSKMIQHAFIPKMDFQV